MNDKAGEVAALGGSRPAATGPGATGAGPLGGGKAVPDDASLMGGSGSLGDTASMDDGGLNSGDTLEELDGATASPQASALNTENAADGDAPTGGLSGTPVPSSGTAGGSPTGTAASGMGDKGG